MKKQTKQSYTPKIKNKSLQKTKTIIGYIKELNYITGSALSSLLMQQLDYWFIVNEETYNKDYIYKFLEPCNNKNYKDGDSWTEELGFSKAEFRTAFDNIGIRYKSKRESTLHKDPFQGKFYYSYFDRIKGLTFYFRNHEILDPLIDKVFNGEFTDIKNVNLRKSRKLIYGSKESEFTDVKNVDFEYITEITTENTTEITTDTFFSPNGDEKKSSFSNSLEFLSKKEIPLEDKILDIDSINKLTSFLDRLEIYGKISKSQKLEEKRKVLDKWIDMFSLERVMKAINLIEAQTEMGVCSYNLTQRYVFDAIVRITPDEDAKVVHSEKGNLYQCKCRYLFSISEYHDNCPVCGTHINMALIDEVLDATA